jgi:hypothetical protein
LLAPHTKTRRRIRSLDGIVPTRREHSQNGPADDGLIVCNENPRHDPAAVRLQKQEGYLISVQEPYSARAAADAGKGGGSGAENESSLC